MLTTQGLRTQNWQDSDSGTGRVGMLSVLDTFPNGGDTMI